MKKKPITLYAFANFHPKKHRTKRYIIGMMEGEEFKPILEVCARDFKWYKKNFRIKIKKVV